MTALPTYAILRTPAGFAIRNVKTGEDVVICDTSDDAVDVAARLNQIAAGRPLPRRICGRR
jgi:hypothetical protein